MTAPALSTVRCLSSVFAEMLRVARLHADGSLDPGSQNLYVSDAVVQIGRTAVVEAGDQLRQRNGAGNICVSVNGKDEVVGVDLALQLCQLDVELIEMLTGATLVTSGGVSVGFQIPKSGDDEALVCFEAWSQARGPRTQATEDGDLLWWHWIWPEVTWILGDYTIGNEIMVVPLTGHAEENDDMGTGPAADWPALFTAAEGVFLDADIPPAVCGYQALVVAGSAS